MGYKSNNNIVYSCKYHIVWCSKCRKPLLLGPIAIMLKDMLYQVAKEYGSQIIELKVMPDHVHLLAQVNPQFGVSRLVKYMKGRSSKLLRDSFQKLRELPSLWTNSCFMSTVGGAPLHIVKQYIQNQKYV